MSDFRFACPHCGQRISCDSSLRGSETVCPSCQKKLIIPAPAAKAAAPMPRSAARISGLAIASLVCACFPGIGALPGILCGYLALRRIQRTPALLGKGMALAGLIVSCLSLAGTIAFVTPRLIARSQKTIVIRKESQERELVKLRGIDEVIAGDPASESEHRLQSSGSENGFFFGRRWRACPPGQGRFSYVLKCLPDQAISLNCRYWGSDTGGRVFDIAVEQQVIATEILDNNVPEQFFDVEYKIPRKLTRGKREITVEFRAHQGKSAGGVFNCQTIKR